MRRSRFSQREAPLVCGDLKLDPVSHRVFVGSRVLDIEPTEYKLLQFFMTHQERAYTRSQLLDQVWGGNVYVEERTVDVHIRRLRKTLEVPGYDDVAGFVQTVRGTGYRFSFAGAIEWCNEAARILLGRRYPDDQRRLLSNLLCDPQFTEYFQSRGLPHGIGNAIAQQTGDIAALRDIRVW